jgi:hypothetical protein
MLAKYQPYAWPHKEMQIPKHTPQNIKYKMVDEVWGQKTNLYHNPLVNIGGGGELMDFWGEPWIRYKILGLSRQRKEKPRTSMDVMEILITKLL